MFKSIEKAFKCFFHTCELSALPQCPAAQCAASLFDFAAFGQRESTSSGSKAVGKRSSAGESPLVVQVFDRGGVVVIVH